MSINKFSFSPNFPKTLNLLLGFLLLFFTFSGCDCCKRKPLVEIVSRIQAPTGISFIDAQTGTANVKKVKVTLIDPEGMVRSSNGVDFDTVTITGGVMSLGLLQQAVLSESKPYRYFVRAEANGYSTNIMPIVITKDAPQHLPIFMVNFELAPSQGLGVAAGNFMSVSNGTLQQSLPLSTRVLNAKSAPINVVLQEGLHLLSGGKPIEQEGQLSYRLLLGQPGDSVANRVFPGGFEVPDAVDESGKRLSTPESPLFFTTAGWFTLEMNIGNVRVDGFSKPVNVEMPVGDAVVNPTTQKPLREDEEVPLWSMDNQTGIWKQEGKITVKRNADGLLVANFSISHLSTFNLDFPGATCSTISFTSTPSTDFPAVGSYYMDFISASDGAFLKSKVVNITTSPLNVVRVPNTISGNVLVRTGMNPSDPAGWSSTTVSCATPTGTLAKIGSGVLPSGCVTLRFLNISDNSIVSICNNSVWHKNGCGDLLYLLANYLNGTHDVLIPRTGGVQKCIRVWYLNSSAQQVSLDFQIDLSASGRQVNRPIDIHIAGVAQPAQLFDYEVTTAISPCDAFVTIYIPNSIIVGGVCPI